ncbi:hypothetical protein ACJMK2_033697 [Sinanodonta woodiana]|uniref:Cadherin domain-containing protein n=1 Tax=Sinanodonta woodiana TaxID=1069815 RepID=A0ABD3WP60_SINWO
MEDRLVTSAVNKYFSSKSGPWGKSPILGQTIKQKSHKLQYDNEIVTANEPPTVTNIQEIQFIIKPEDTLINSTLGTIRAVDIDGPQELTFSITEATTRDLVKLGPPQGLNRDGRSVDIILIAQLDCDRQSGERKLYFQVSDKADLSGNNIPVVLTLFISDVNDEDPTFNNSRYKGSVMENASMGTVVLTVKATDLDNGLGGSVTYSLEGVSDGYRTAFLINPNSGAVTVHQSLDYETFNFYEFTLIARDGGGRNGTAELLITVNDVQDTPPAFYNLPYSVRIPENVSLQTSILQVTALDGDRGVENKVTYSFFEGSFEFFSLDNVTGVIRVKMLLDRDSPSVRDKGGVYDMKVKASEVVPPGQVNTGVTTATTLVTITVIDINDNSPMFNSLSYNATILENMQQGVPITFIAPFTIMNVSDIDQGSNSHFELFLEKDGRPYSDFTPQPNEVFSESSVLIRVNNQSALDYEITSQLTFQIIAREMDTAEHRSSSATITVQILNVNDNEPIFHSDSFNCTVKENSQNGTHAIRMQAHDADLGDFGKLTYSVRGSNDRFSINATTGEVFVSGELDREKVDKYYLTVEAKDGGGFRTPVELEVTILDENDNPPLFRRNEYYGTVQENRMNFTRGTIQIQAVDDDEPNSPNSQVLYKISKAPWGLTSNFTVDNQTGVISLTQTLDYEKLDPRLEGKIILTVEAYDNGVPNKTSFINVTVEVEDENDNSPQFTQLKYYTSILENATSGASVLSVTAIDLDGTSPNNNFLYRIDSGAMDKFRINFQTGLITVEVGAVLDRESKSQYILNISATDRGSQPLVGYCVLEINITDVNDEDPVFTPASQSASVLENSEIGHIVTTVTASDADLNYHLVYRIISNSIKAKDENGLEVNVTANNITDYFGIHAGNGSIYVNSTLDRETAEVITMEILATDLNAWIPGGNSSNPQTATAMLTITLLDFNDNDPEFIPTSTYQLNVSEGLEINAEVLRLQTRDKDKGQTIRYQINNNPFNKFSVTSAGVVILIQRLDREAQDNLVLTLIALDDGKPARTSTATVSLHVTDVNDNSPVFQDYNMQYTVPEDATINQVIAVLSATDRDIGDFGKVFYRLEVQDNDGKLSINESSGAIFVAKELDRETRSSYTVSVTACDNKADPNNQRPNTTKPIIIGVVDINDNKPVFTNVDPTVILTVQESAGIGHLIYTVTAEDLDEGLNAQINYTISGNATVMEKFKVDTVGRTVGTQIKNFGEIKVNGNLRGLFGNFELNITASDRGSLLSRNTTASLVITVMDENLNNPVFVQPEGPRNAISVKEEQPVNTEVIKLIATDADHGMNAAITYTLLDEGDYQKFRLDPVTGSLSNKELLDRETKDKYELKIEAADGGNPRLATILSLTIVLLDVNDNPPEFSRGSDMYPYKVYIEEERMGADTTRSLAIAVDRDSEAQNLLICYYIIGGDDAVSMYLHLDDGGNLTLIKPLDREALPVPFISLIVWATPQCSLNIPNNLRPAVFPPTDYDRNQTLLWARVYITDVNDNPPEFRQSPITVGVTRDTELGTFIANLQEEVRDKDEQKNVTFETNEIQIYPEALRNQINQQVRDPFLVLKNGSVKTNTYFKSDMSGYFLINVSAIENINNGSFYRVHGLLRISLINDDQRVKVVFKATPAAVNEFKADFVQKLQNVTGFRIVVDKVQTHANAQGNPDDEKTDMFIHAEDMKTNETIPAAELLRSIDYHAEALLGLRYQYKVLEIVPTESAVKAENLEDTFRMALILVAIILSLLCMIILVIFYLVRIKYQRKLKAATAMSYSSDSDLRKLEMPGTNQHAYENINPIYMEKVMLDTQEEQFDDYSLDENAVDPGNMTPYDEKEVSMNFNTEDPKQISLYKLSTGDALLNETLRQHEATKAQYDYLRYDQIKDTLATIDHTQLKNFPTTEI